MTPLDKYRIVATEDLHQLESKVEEALESQNFYDLMQQYRWSRENNQKEVSLRYEAVKEFILQQLK